MAQWYSTRQGDTFDLLAKRFYGTETMLRELMDANPGCAHMVVFSAGTVLWVPDVSPQERQDDSLPPWRLRP